MMSEVTFNELLKLAEGMAESLEYERDNYPAMWVYCPRMQKALNNFRAKVPNKATQPERRPNERTDN